MASAATGIELRAEEYDAGAAVELAWETALGETKTARGRFRAYAGGKLMVEVGGQLRQYQGERVRYLSPVDEEAHCASFRYDEAVRITKYGGQYTAHVIKRGRTRLRVAFTTRGGKVKEQSIPAIECERVA